MDAIRRNHKMENEVQVYNVRTEFRCRRLRLRPGKVFELEMDETEQRKRKQTYEQNRFAVLTLIILCRWKKPLCWASNWSVSGSLAVPYAKDAKCKYIVNNWFGNISEPTIGYWT